MQNLLSLWTSLDGRRRAVVAGATLIVFVAVLALSRVAGAPSMALLYGGLDSATAGDIVLALEQRGVAYEVRGDSIHVDATRRDELRMLLAAEGLPANGAAGYELLDSLSGFGTTSQMFDAAYWRAKEGELARTILASPQVRAARVHIAHAGGQPFRRDQRPTASVTVTSVAGTLPPQQAKALKYMVAAAVAGMQPDDVSIIDTVGGLIQTGEDPALSGGSGEDRAEALRRNVERLLVARVGPGKAVVEVSVDVVTEREAITERRFDPQGRVAISTETEERSNTASDPQGAVTVASNLPEGDAGTGGSSQSQSSETRERVNFEVSEVQRELLRSPGAIRRISVAVLVDGVTATATDGTTEWQPRPEGELADLRDLVASAVGFDEARGDVITIKSMPFQPLAEAGTVAEAGMFAGLDILSAIQFVVAALVALVLGLFVIRPVLLAPTRAQAAIPQAPEPLALPTGTRPEAPAAQPRVLTGEIDDGFDLPAMSVVSPEDRMSDGTATEAPGDPITRLRRLIEERQSESVEILRGWMEDREEKV